MGRAFISPVNRYRPCVDLLETRNLLNARSVIPSELVLSASLEVGLRNMANVSVLAAAQSGPGYTRAETAVRTADARSQEPSAAALEGRGASITPEARAAATVERAFRVDAEVERVRDAATQPVAYRDHLVTRPINESVVDDCIEVAAADVRPVRADVVRVETVRVAPEPTPGRGEVSPELPIPQVRRTTSERVHPAAASLLHDAEQPPIATVAKTQLHTPTVHTPSRSSLVEEDSASSVDRDSMTRQEQVSSQDELYAVVAALLTGVQVDGTQAADAAAEGLVKPQPPSCAGASFEMPEGQALDLSEDILARDLSLLRLRPALDHCYEQVSEDEDGLMAFLASLGWTPWIVTGLLSTTGYVGYRRLRRRSRFLSLGLRDPLQPWYSEIEGTSSTEVD